MGQSISYFTLKNIIVLVFAVLIVISVSMQLLPDYVYTHDAQRFYALILLALVLMHSAIYKLSAENLLPISKSIRLSLYGLLIFGKCMFLQQMMCFDDD